MNNKKKYNKVYTVSGVEKAVEDVKTGISILAVSKTVKIPYATLYSRVKGIYAKKLKLTLKIFSTPSLATNIWLSFYNDLNYKIFYFQFSLMFTVVNIFQLNFSYSSLLIKYTTFFTSLFIKDSSFFCL